MAFTPDGGGEMVLDIQAEDNASDAIGGITGSLTGMRTAAAGAGAAMAAIGVGGLAAATGAAIDFEEAMVEVEKVTSTAMAESLEDDIRGIAESTRLAHGEVATLAAQAARFGAEGEEEIAQFTQVAAEMGAATTLASDEAGRALAKTATALGEPLDEVRSLGDAINETSNNYAASSQEIVDSTQRAGASLRSLGMESDEVIGVAAAFNEVSPTSRRAATMMEQVSEAMMDPANVDMFASALGVTAEEFRTMREENPEETMVQLMEATQESDETMRSFRQNLSTAQARAFQRGAANADTFREAMETSNTAMEEGGSLAAENEKDISTLAGQMDILKSRVRTAGQMIGEQMIPALLKVSDAIMPAVDAFITLNEKTNGMAGVAALVGTALSGIAIAAAALAPVIAGTLVPALGAAAGALGAILAPIAAIVAALGLLYIAWDQNLGGFRTAVLDLKETVMESFGGTEGAMDSLKSAVDAAIPPIVDALNVMKDAFAFVLENYTVPLIESFAQLWETHFSDIASETQATMDAIMGYIQPVLSRIQTLWDRHGKQIMTVVKTVFDAIRITITTTLDAVISGVRVAMALLRGDFDGALSIIEGFWNRTFNRILNFFTGSFLKGLTAALDLMVDYITAPFRWIYNFLIGNSIVKKTFNQIINFITNVFFKKIQALFSKIFNFYKTIWTKIFNFYKGIWTKIYNTVKSVLTKYFTFVKNTFNKIFTFYKEIWTTIFNKTKAIVTKIFDFYVSIWTKIYDTVEGAVMDIFNIYKDIFNSLKEFTTQIWDDVEQTIGSAIDGALDAVTNTISSFEDVAGDIVDGMVSPFSELSSSIVDMISDLPSEVVDVFSDAAQSAIDEFNSYIPSSIDLPGLNEGEIASFRVGGSVENPITGTNHSFGTNVDAPPYNIGGQSLNMPQLAEGGIATGETIAQIGEGSQPEAVLPLDKLSSMLDTTYAAGVSGVGGGGKQEVDVRISVEGDDELTRIIRENAEVVVERDNKSKKDRLKRL